MDVAVVTGAGRGMGREIARLLAARGHGVVATDVNPEGAAETAELLGDQVWPLAVDVRDPEAHRAAAVAAGERGTLKAWFNNAGILRTDKAWAHSDDEVRAVVEANLLGVIWGSRTAVEAMRSTGGHIVNMASMSSFGPVPGLAVYGATKHAVLGFSGSLQGDLQQEGSRSACTWSARTRSTRAWCASARRIPTRRSSSPARSCSTRPTWPRRRSRCLIPGSSCSRSPETGPG